MAIAMTASCGCRLLETGYGDDNVVVRSSADAVRMCAETGCDGTAVARGIMRDPFLIRKIVRGSDAPATDADRMRFLKTLYRCSAHAEKWRRNGFMECIRMCSGGADSELFQRCIRLSDEELAGLFTDASAPPTPDTRAD